MQEYWSLLSRNRNFRLMWLGAVSSYAGDWFNLIASAELISRFTDSGLAISFLFLARFLPAFLISPFAGVVADRFNRRNIMIAVDLLRVVVVLGFLLVRSAEHVWLFYTLTVLQFALSSIFQPAKSAVIPNIVDKEDLVTANAVDSTTWSAMLAVGSLLGGVATAVLGSEAAFVLDALTFAVSALLIARVDLPKPTEADAETLKSAEKSRNGLFDFLEGLRYLRQHPFLLRLSLVKAAGAIAWAAINVLEIDFAFEVYGGDRSGEVTLGIIYLMSSIGTGLAPIFFRNLLGTQMHQLRRGITIGYVLLFLGLFVIGLEVPFALFLLGTTLRTSGSGTMWVFSGAMLQQTVSDQVRGRVFAFEFAALTLVQSISTLWAGIGRDRFGFSLREICLMMAGIGVVSAVWWINVNIRWTRHEAMIS